MMLKKIPNKVCKIILTEVVFFSQEQSWGGSGNLKTFYPVKYRGVGGWCVVDVRLADKEKKS